MASTARELAAEHLSPIKGRWTGAEVRDPITNLLAFPAFHDHFAAHFHSHLSANSEVGIAIGDVDSLKEYVEGRKSDDPQLFGHLAGNALMRDLGIHALQWFCDWVAPWGVVSTFGGDEIIIACAGIERHSFESEVRTLSDLLAESLPCSVSFACGWFKLGHEVLPEERRFNDDYVNALVLVDKALFKHKEERKENRVAGRVTGFSASYRGVQEWQIESCP